MAPKTNFMPFVCTLCERQKMIHSGRIKHRSSRVTGLIRPEFPRFDQSHVPMMMRARECEVALVVGSKQVFIPRTVKDISPFHICDNQRLDGVLEDVIEVAKDMGFPQATINTITNGLTICINYEHLWVEATYEQLATIVLYITAARVGIEEPCMLSQLSNCLSASMKGIKQLHPAVTVLLIDTGARYAISSFMQKFKKTHPASRQDSKDFTGLQMRLWRLVLKQDLFPLDFIAANWRRIVTSCIYAVNTVNDIFLDTEEISVAIGAGSAGIGGYGMDTYLLSYIVDDKAYQIKCLAVKTRRQRKLQARSGKSIARYFFAAYAIQDPFI